MVDIGQLTKFVNILCYIYIDSRHVRWLTICDMFDKFYVVAMSIRHFVLAGYGPTKSVHQIVSRVNSRQIGHTRMTSNRLRVAFNNVEKFGIAKQSQIQKTLGDHDCDIFGIIETGFSDRTALQVCHPEYKWIPKNRKDRDGGGIGIFIKSTLGLINEDSLDTQNDSMERMWITVRTEGPPLSIGVVYFPNDNINKSKSETLTTEIIQNVNSLVGKGHEILLLGDFNGRLPNFAAGWEKSHNGKLLQDVSDICGMIVVNTLPLCKGKITWFRGSRTSTIDYILCSAMVAKSILTMTIDELGNLSCGSDHNVIICDMSMNVRLAGQRTQDTTNITYEG